METNIFLLEDARRGRCEAERVLREAENVLKKHEDIEFDLILKVCLLAGHENIALEAMSGSMQIERPTVRVFLRRALVRLQKRELSYKWEEEWNCLCLSLFFSGVKDYECRI